LADVFVPGITQAVSTHLGKLTEAGVISHGKENTVRRKEEKYSNDSPGSPIEKAHEEEPEGQPAIDGLPS
jgi:hypothetical protein